MKRLFYVRHGETHMNVAKTLSGRTETPLTKNGVDQAIKTGREVKASLPKIDLIICSPFERTYETAKLIAKEIGYPIEEIQKSDLFIERTFGVLEGTHAQDFLSTHDYKDFDEIEGAETIENLDKRAKKAFEYVKGLKEHDNILVVGHGAFGRAIRRIVNNLPHTNEYEEFQPIDNAVIVELI